MLPRPCRALAPALAVLALAALAAPTSAWSQACGIAFEDLASLALPPPEPETRLVTRDLDLDGRDEILVTYPTCPGSVWIVGSDGSSLSVLQVLGPADGLAASPSGIDAADVDLDGDVDLVVGHLEGTGCGGRGVTVFPRRADGTWGDGRSHAGDNDGRHLLALDLEGGGRPLVITADGPLGSNPTTGKAVQIRENEGPGAFDHVHEYGLQPVTGGDVPGLLVAGMLDGRPTGDLLVYWPNRLATTGLCNFGDSTFELVVERDLRPTLTVTPTGAAAADLNADGLLDLVVAHGTAASLVVHLAQPAGGARACAVPGAGGSACSTAPGLQDILLTDFDGDGEADILGLLPESEELGLHGGGGDGVFSTVKRHPHDGVPARAASGPLAGDPRPDLAVLDQDGTLHLLRNDSRTENCPTADIRPQAVGRADADCRGSLVLDGSPSSDPDGDALTYLWSLDGEVVLETDEAISEYPVDIGTYSFVLVVRDETGNESRPDGITLRLRDGVAPDLTADPPEPAECEGPEGARVTLTAAATDECSTVVLSSNHGSGDTVVATFPIGDSVVEWTARDAGSNRTMQEVTVSVVDTTPPDLDCPSLVSVDCPGTGGAEVDLRATVTDRCSEACSIHVANDRGPGGANASGFYPPGETLVRFQAQDAFGNLATCESRVVVVDVGPPTLSLPPSPLVVPCRGDGGSFAAVTAEASDDCTGVELDNDFSGGSEAVGFFPLGTTTVRWTARDAAGNETLGETVVQVVDGDAPFVDCSGELRVECSGDRSAQAGPRAHAVDACDASPVVSNDRTSGGRDASDRYSLGETLVRFEAEDASGNAGACLTRVLVEDTMAPELSSPAEVRVACDGGGEAFVQLTAQVSDCCDPAPVVVNDRTGGGRDASGSYPLGTTLVTFSARDLSGNVAERQTRVIVEDAQPPLLGCPSLLETECLGPAGTRVSLQAFAADACGPVVVTNDRTGGGADASGLYPLGDTSVRFTAQDGAGLLATCETTVRVADTLPPRVLVEAEGACLWPPNHRFVRFRLGEELRVIADDLCAGEGELELEILEVTSNESEDGRGDGATAPDVVVRGDELFVRAERDGGAPGRVYAVRLGVTDPAGNTAVGEVELRVPHSGRPPEGCKTLPNDRFFSDEEVLGG